MEKAIECLTKNYANFSGRAPRSEYWMFTLLMFLLGAAIGLIIGIAGGIFGIDNMKSLISLFQNILFLATIIPSVAVSVRRLHDVDKSGWWLLIGLIPIIGAIWLFVLYCTKGTEGDNRFGSDPLQV